MVWSEQVNLGLRQVK